MIKKWRVSREVSAGGFLEEVAQWCSFVCGNGLKVREVHSSGRNSVSELGSSGQGKAQSDGVAVMKSQTRADSGPWARQHLYHEGRLQAPDGSCTFGICPTGPPFMQGWQ